MRSARKLKLQLRSSMKKMKRTIPGMLLTVMLTGCDRPKHVSVAEFKREFDLRNQ